MKDFLRPYLPNQQFLKNAVIAISGVIVIAMLLLLGGCGGGSMSPAVSNANPPVTASTGNGTGSSAPTPGSTPPTTPPPTSNPPSSAPPAAAPPSTAASTNQAPPVPANANLISQIQTMPGWESCTGARDGSECAGGMGQANYSQTQQINSPSLTGSAAEFFLGDSSASQYSNALWWKQLEPNPNATNFVYDVFFYLKDADAPQSLEFDVNQTVAGNKYIFGTECNLRGPGTWQVWDTPSRRWTPTGIPCPKPASDTWNHVVLEFQRTADNKVKFISVSVNGNKMPIDRISDPLPQDGNELNVAFQMDGNYRQQNFSVWLDKVNLYSW